MLRPSLLLACALVGTARAAGPGKSKVAGRGLHESHVPPDTRPAACRRSFGDADLGANVTVSIIIPYLREKWEHFHRTMRSIFHFTPEHLIEEFILVSDGNPPEFTYEKRLKGMSPKVRLIKNEERLGLIKAKMIAVAEAKAEVLVFMEPHCIVNRDWLQPLLVRLRESPRALVQPTLDVIPQDQWGMYYKGAQGIWRFEWNMNLIYSVPPDTSDLDPESPEPHPSPATSGGIFAVRRAWWQRLQFYDPELKEWGGDHVEASMKVWRCGGHVDLHPCSRVGHLFRDPDHRPYDVVVNTVVRNYARLAKVWFDSYLPQFYKVKPEAKQMDVGDLSEQQAFREEMKCKDMAWYTQYVDPEMEWEASRVCIPGARLEQGGCEKPAQPGRSCIDQTMPAKEYKEKRAAARAYFKNEGRPAADEL